MKFTKYVAVFGFLAPAFAFAQVRGGNTDLGPIEELVRDIGGIINLLIPILIAVLFLVFVWGLIQYVMNSGSDDAQKEAKRKMIGGILALFVVVAIWGIITFIAGLLGVDDQGELGGTIQTPEIDDLPGGN